MIVLAITVITVIILLLGLSVSYFAQQDAVEQQKEEASLIQNQRIREDLTIRYDNETGNLDVFNDAADATRIVGLMARCDNGEIKTRDLAIRAGTGENLNITDSGTGRHIEAEILALRTECP